MLNLVTGGTGFIGSHLVDILVSKGEDVRLLVRKTSKIDKFKNPGVDFVYGDITDKDTLKGIAKDVDIVYHLAAMGHVSAISDVAYQNFIAVNVNGTKNLADECSNHPISKFIHFSSTAAMGLIEKPIVDESTPCRPSTPYQKSKYDSEKMILNYWRTRNLPVVIIRPSMVYGPGGESSEFLKICRIINKGIFPQIGKGKNLTPIVYVDDVVRAAIMAAERGIPGETYLITSENSYKLRVIAKLVADQLGVKRVNHRMPVSIAMSGAFIIELFARIFNFTPIVTPQSIKSAITDRVFSIDKAKRELGYKPEVSLEDGIKRTIDWYVKEGILPKK
jgi:nucleoside-diphosphate-sugar epimerase